jgi:DNA-binding CsgD family transcriptional regulator
VLERVRASVRALGTAWSDVLGNLIELIMADDVDAGRAGLDAALRLGNLRYEPDFRLHLGRVGVDPATNLPAALRMFTELGSVDSAESAVAEMRRLGLRVPARRRADRFALTDAEQRVAELVADGLSNRAIADRLAYSVKTIEAYLSRIYAKTGCRNRVDLTRRFTVPVP